MTEEEGEGEESEEAPLPLADDDSSDSGETKTSTSAGSSHALCPLMKRRFFSTLARGRMTRPPERSERVSLLATSAEEAGRPGGWPPPEWRGG